MERGERLKRPRVVRDGRREDTPSPKRIREGGVKGRSGREDEEKRGGRRSEGERE
jgi:hypothetical protein